MSNFSKDSELDSTAKLKTKKKKKENLQLIQAENRSEGFLLIRLQDLKLVWSWWTGYLNCLAGFINILQFCLKIYIL